MTPDPSGKGKLAMSPTRRCHPLWRRSWRYLVFARLHARHGRQSEVHQAMFEVQGPTRQEPGCVGYGGFRSVRDPDEFYIHSRWRDMAAFERHAALPHTVRFVETVELPARPSVQGHTCGATLVVLHGRRSYLHAQRRIVE